MIEIIAGIIVLILAIIGVAELSKRRNRDPRRPVRKIDISQIDTGQNLYRANQALEALYYLGTTSDLEKASQIAKDVFKYIGEHQEEFYAAAKKLGIQRDIAYKEFQKIKQRYDQFFDEKIAAPRLEAIKGYDAKRRIISTALSETQDLRPSWVAYWSKAISGKEVMSDTADILKYHRVGYEIRKKANQRKEQARAAQTRARSGRAENA